MIPLKDNLRYASFAWVSVAIFALNVLMYIGEATLDTGGQLQTTISSWLPVRDVLSTALVNGDPWLLGRSVAALFLAMFLHGSYGHLFGNMCFFFAFSPALEAKMGHGRFAIFYLVSGVLASLTFVVTDTGGVGHILGASGAIGGVLGAYVIYYPRARVDGLTGTFNFITTLSVFFLAEYVIMQWMSLWAQLGGVEEAAGVAFSAHIGGMTTGMAVAAVMLLKDVGRLRLRDMSFYLVGALAAVLAFVQPLGGVSPWLWYAVASSGVLVIWVSFFQNTFSGWWKRLSTPIVTMFVAYLGGIAFERGVAASKLAPGLLQSFNVYGVCVLIMVATVVIAIAARRLPVITAQPVTMPIPAIKDRLLSEVVADLVIAFFRFIARGLSHGRALLMTVLSYLTKMLGLVLGVGGSVIASGYARITPVSLKARLSSIGSGLRRAAGRLGVWTVKTARRLRLDFALRRFLLTLLAVRNRLVVTSA